MAAMTKFYNIHNHRNYRQQLAVSLTELLLIGYRRYFPLSIEIVRREDLYVRLMLIANAAVAPPPPTDLRDDL